MTNAYCATSEKQLLIDSLQDDICEYTKLVSEMQHQVWATNQKNENQWNEKSQLETIISREYEAIEVSNTVPRLLGFARYLISRNLIT